MKYNIDFKKSGIVHTRYYDNNKELLEKVDDDIRKISITHNGSLKDLTDFDLEVYIANNYAFIVDQYDVNTSSIWFYDYDLKQYVASDRLLFEIMSSFEMKHVNNQKVDRMIKALSKPEYSMTVRNLNDDEISFRNKIVNYKTKESIDYSPDLFITSFIDNEYIEIENHPTTPENLDIFNIIWDAANHKYSRYIGLLQVARQLVLKTNLGDSIIQFIGPGGHGKSVIGSIFEAMIGKQNVVSTTIDQFNDKDAIYSLVNTHAVIGDDISDNVYIKDSKNLKTISAGGSVMTTPKYQRSMKVSYQGPIIQLAPNIIRMSDSGGQFHRRIKPYLFEHNFVNDENQISKNDLNKFINREEVQQYFIYQLLNNEELIHDDFVGWDDHLLEEITNTNDSMQIFQRYIEKHTKILDMDKIPVKALLSIYEDLIDDDTKSHNKMQVREFLRRNNDFFRRYHFEKDQFHKMRQTPIKKYLENDYSSDMLEELVENAIDKNNKVTIDKVVGPNLQQCLDENKTSTYLVKMS